jgi:hypothetical protein
MIENLLSSVLFFGLIFQLMGSKDLKHYKDISFKKVTTQRGGTFSSYFKFDTIGEFISTLNQDSIFKDSLAVKKITEILED